MTTLQEQYQRKKKRAFIYLLLLLLCLPFLLLLDVATGSVQIPFSETVKVLFGGMAEKQSWHLIIADTRFPQAITAIAAGAGLSVCGLLLQTYFRNPLAGPSVLGISSGAAFGVAVVTMGGTLLGMEFTGVIAHSAIILSAVTGAVFVLILILVFSRYSNNTTTVLIAGLMIAYLVGAMTQLLEQFAAKDELQRFVYWGFGSFAGHSLYDSYLFTGMVLLLLIPVLWLVKPLNTWSLGENYAVSLGISVKKVRWQIILVSGLLTGVVTAYCGPVAFIGLAVPHLVRRLIRINDHFVLIPAVALAGAILASVCSTITKLPVFNGPLPLNAVTSLFGAPVVIWILLRNNRKGVKS